ncbi:AAA family ATPase [Brevundimonas sp.]|uniref:AAA family ATPase n=1 Tax=Brevundimonas sp. TaxID=1871086 RepID=UPI003F6EB82A
MTKAFKFNPGFQSDEEAVANFIVRRVEFEAVLETLAPPDSSKAPPRVLVVAPRGAGKTTLCRRVLAESRGDGRFADTWHAIFLGEESYVVTTPGEFFLECLFHLRDQASTPRLEAGYELAVAAKTEGDLIAAAVSALRDFSTRSGRRLLIVVENFHIILNDQIGNDGDTLLTLLADDSLFGVLATSVVQALDDERGAANRLPTDYRRIPLQPLTISECHALWEALTHQPVRRERIRPLQILTGGSPRLLHILADFMRTPSLQDLMENLNRLIDENTEYFKSQLDALPPVERKVFAALLDAWDPKSAKQISEAARVNVNIASAMLNRLADRGAVVKAAGDGRAAIYYAAERLFNIYYLMRRRSHPSSRVRALVSFMTEYYDQDELVSTTAMIAKEACGLEPARRGDHHSTWDAIMSIQDEDVRSRILSRTPREFILSFRKDLAVRHDEPASDDAAETLDIIQRVEAAVDRGDFNEALVTVRDFTSRWPQNSEAWLRTALIEQRLDNSAAAIAAAGRAIELAPQDAWTWAVYGRTLKHGHQNADAEAALNRALELDPAQIMAAAELADIRQDAGDLEGALQIYRDARTVGEMPDFLWVRYALLLMEAGRDDEVEEALRTGAAENAENRATLTMLVDLMLAADRVDEGASLLMSAAETAQTWEAWADLGSYLHSVVSDEVQARSALEKAVERGADQIYPYGQLGLILIDEGAPPEALRALASSLLQNVPDKGAAWALAGDILATVDEEEGEQAYRTAIAEGDSVRARLGLARLLSEKLARRPEAEAMLREVVANPSRSGLCAASRDLADLLVHKGEDLEAEDVVRQGLEENSECICCLLLHGQICARRGDTGTAIESYDAALALDDESINALTSLALLDSERAPELVRRASELAPDDPRCLHALAKTKSDDPEAYMAVLRATLEIDPDFLPAALALAPLEAGHGELGAALGRLQRGLDRLMMQREWLGELVTAAMATAQRGYAGEVYRLIEDHDAAANLEPLLVALQLTRGETPRVANEVLEVAKDIIEQSQAV